MTAQTRLARSLNSRSVVVLTLSALSPAASVFITGAGVLRLAGTGAAIALLLGGAIAVVGGLLYAELGGAFPRAGGVYPGVAQVLGARAGFALMTLALFTAAPTLSFISLGFADYLHVLSPSLPRAPLAWGALALAGALASLNIRANAAITGVFLAAEMIALLVLGAVAGVHPVRGLADVLLHPVMATPGRHLVPTPFWTLMLASLSGAYACAGAGLAIYFAEELEGEPTRIGAIVALTAVAATTIVVLPLVLLNLAIPDPSRTLAADAPIAEFLRQAAGPPVAYGVTVLVALAILNNVIASLLAFARLVYATGRDQAWPGPIARCLATLHGRFRSPWLASLALAVCAAALCFVGEHGLLVLLSGEVFSAALVAAAVIVGRRRGQTGVSSFRTPLFPALPILGLGIIIGFFVADWHDPGAGRHSLFLLGGVTVLALAGFSVVPRRGRTRQ